MLSVLEIKKLGKKLGNWEIRIFATRVKFSMIFVCQIILNWEIWSYIKNRWN